MTRTRKTWIVAGGLLVAATGAGYLMLLRADHRAIAESGIGEPAATVANPSVNDAHTAQGAIAPPAPAIAGAAPASAPVVGAVPAVGEKPRPSVKPGAPPTGNVVTVDAQDSTPANARPAQRSLRQRDRLERHAAVNTITKQSETPETAALVRESAKLDPALPPPRRAADITAARQGAAAGANPVAAAMTEQLVRASSSFKPSAPAKGDSAATP
ncbi:hypothetical protein ACVBGC_03000 [Burkholderia stagnalis]